MDKIPETLHRKVRVVAANGKVTFKDEQIDLIEPSLPVAATFESDNIGLRLYLVPSQSVVDPASGNHEKLDNTEVRIRFRGGKWRTRNFNMMKLLMDSSAYKRGLVRIDPEDPTGFWRAQGFVKTKMVPVIEEVKVLHPSADEINLEKLENNLKDHKDKIAPISKVV